MKRTTLPLYAIALAIAIVGLVALGVSPGTLFLLLTVAVCPLMMFFMMRGGHGHDDTDRTGGDADPLHKHHQDSPGSPRS
ncbi:DUF2933 domain-containing protein [Streptomyces niger]|uniref:DUF2933 domain-containing protein n=1 Tax=Streptomyces niger TaxID=66373 RepID=UPI00069B4534|nr:DUF2933 domain-containing protein [Streptomyces niger]